MKIAKRRWSFDGWHGSFVAWFDFTNMTYLPLCGIIKLVIACNLVKVNIIVIVIRLLQA
jgi:hypothetical protein